MAKKKEKQRGGLRVIPAHWHAPATAETPAEVALAGERPTAWPLGPGFATRIDTAGSQGVFLSRQRPWGSLTVVGAVVNDLKGVTDGMGDHAIGQPRIEERVAGMGGPSHRAYLVPPEYVRFRLRQGEAQAERTKKELPAAYRPWRHLLEGVDPDWEPDFGTLEATGHRPALLDKTGVLVHAAEFTDWGFAPEEHPEAKEFLAAVDQKLEELPDKGQVPPGTEPPPSADLAVLAEAEVLTVNWPLTEEATQQVERLFDEYLMRMVPREAANRYRDRLLNMAYLTDLAGQPEYSSLIATAAWGLNPDRAFPPAHHPFLRALARKTVERHVLGLE